MKTPRPHELLLCIACALLISRDCSKVADATSTAIVVDQKVCTGTAAGSGGSMTCDYASTTDRGSWVIARASMTALTTGHLSATGLLFCEAVFENKNGTLSLATALASSANPQGNTSTTFVASHAQAADSAFVGAGPPTCAWSVSGTNERVTVSNTGGTTADVTVWIQAFNFGSQ